VELFPLPDTHGPLARKIVTVAKKIYKLVPSPQVENLEAELDRLVWKAFGHTITRIKTEVDSRPPKSY